MAKKGSCLTSPSCLFPEFCNKAARYNVFAVTVATGEGPAALIACTL
jgi:hypothetical protein